MARDVYATYFSVLGVELTCCGDRDDCDEVSGLRSDRDTGAIRAFSSNCASLSFLLLNMVQLVNKEKGFMAAG